MVTHDLVREFPAAVTRWEVAKIDLGTPEARPLLLDGWGEDESNEEGPFVWSLGDGAELQLYVAAPTDLTAVLRCRTLAFDGAPPQVVSLAAGGRTLGEVEVGTAFADYRIAIPAAALEEGSNRLSLRTSQHHRPAEVIPGSADERPLAVQWDSITFEGLTDAAPPRLVGDGSAEGAGAVAGDRLELPAASEVSYYLRARPGDELVIGDLARRGNGGVGLRVSVETDGASLHEPLDIDGEARPLRWRLPVTSPSFARLTLSASRTAAARNTSGKAPALSLLLPMVMRDGPHPDPLPQRERAPPPGQGPHPSPRRPPIFIYLIDALRADHLGVYGYERPTSPAIDRFAEDAVVFANAQAQSSWTRTAVASTFTGLLPQVHGVNDRNDALAQPIHTMAEILGDAGYRCRGLVTNGNVSAAFGLGQGFHQYRHLGESKRQVSIHQLSHRVNQSVFEWIESGELLDHEPLFLYLHATDPHAPYTPPEEFRKRFASGVDPAVGRNDHVRAITLGEKPAPAGTREDWIDLYDGENAYNDHHFGVLMERLRELDLYDRSLIVVLSDHGEEFLDHGGWQHGRTLYGEQLRIPLIVKLPGNQAAGTRVDALANQIDLLPTILDYLGVEPPSPLDGRSLLPRIGGEDGGAPSFSYLALGARRIHGVVADGWKLILDESPNHPLPIEKLYRVEEDPGETAELQGAHALEEGYLRQTLRGLEVGLRGRSQSFTPDQAEMSDELRERLKALGYIQ